MKTRFRFYTEDDFLIIQDLVLASYRWCVPGWSFSRHQFIRGLHPAFKDCQNNWRHTTGLWFEQDRLIACVISEGCYEGDAFFLFDSQARSEDQALLQRMFEHAETHLSSWQNDDRNRVLGLRIPGHDQHMEAMALARGYRKTDEQERNLIMPFSGQAFPVNLPEGYRIADGKSTPDFFLSNTHMFSFNYGQPYAETGEQAFRDLRKMPGYRPELDLSVLDPDGKPVGIAIIWYDERIPYCELEPMGVVWWCRRKGIGKALIYEAANRVMNMGPCRGMLGGDQPFYWSLGFELQSASPIWQWQQSF